MSTRTENLEKISQILQESTIQIPKSLMAYDDIEFDTKVIFSILLDECIKSKWEKERFIDELTSVSIDRITIECVCSRTKAKLIKNELLELIPDLDDILYLNEEE